MRKICHNSFFFHSSYFLLCSFCFWSFSGSCSAYFDPPTLTVFNKKSLCGKINNAFKFGMLILNSDMLSVYNELNFHRVVWSIKVRPNRLPAKKGWKAFSSTGARLLLLLAWLAFFEISTMKLLLTCIREEEERLCGLKHHDNDAQHSKEVEYPINFTHSQDKLPIHDRPLQGPIFSVSCLPHPE